jgi:hypothetical protein
MFVQGMELPTSLHDMIWGFVRAIRKHYSEVDLGSSGGQAEVRAWSEKIDSRRIRLNEEMVFFANMIANSSWHKGSEYEVEGVIHVFHLLSAGYMSPPVVLTCIKWLGANLNDEKSCEETVNRLIKKLNYHWSGWRRVESSEGPIPALEDASRILLLRKELENVVPLSYAIEFSEDDW